MSEQLALSFDLPGLSPEESTVWAVIREHRGKGNEILGTAIAAKTGIEYTTVRAIIADLVNRKGRTIASNGNGYFIPVTKEEVIAATKSLRHRGIMILWRASKLTGNSLEEVFHQGRIEFQEPEVPHA